MKKLAFVLSIVALAVSARNASAQGFVNPFVGVTLTTPSTSGSSSKAGFGVALGSLGGFVGGATEFAYYPEVLDKSANGLSKSRVVLLTGDTLIGPHIGTIKVYGAFGAGNMWLNVRRASNLVVPSPTNITNNYFTFNVGGGVGGVVAPHIGIRGDLRYYRAFGFNAEDLSGAGLSLSHFDFWRAAGGVLFTF